MVDHGLTMIIGTMVDLDSKLIRGQAWIMDTCYDHETWLTMVRKKDMVDHGPKGGNKPRHENMDYHV